MFHPQNTKPNPDPIKLKNQMQKTNLPVQSKMGEFTNQGFHGPVLKLQLTHQLLVGTQFRFHIPELLDITYPTGLVRC
jgi:hypothetical protein